MRGLQHNLSERAKRAIDSGLALRKQTRLHLDQLTENREYLGSRYDVETLKQFSQLNRIRATLDQVGDRVTKLICTAD